MNRGLVLLLLIISLVILVACVQEVGLKSLPPQDEFENTPREGCNNNGIVEGEEECDDGNWIKNDQCDRCKKTYCGDEEYNNNPSNLVNYTEQCDSDDSERGRKQCSNTTGIN